MTDEHLQCHFTTIATVVGIVFDERWVKCERVGYGQMNIKVQGSVEFAQLKRLAALFGTKNIDVSGTDDGDGCLLEVQL